MKNFPRITGDNTDEPYYVRAKFFLNIQETDMYGFHMISDHSGKLYVSTDDNPANAVSSLLLSAESLAVPRGLETGRILVFNIILLIIFYSNK